MCNIRCSVKAAKLDSVKIKVKTNVMLYIKYCPIKKDKNLKVIFRKTVLESLESTIFGLQPQNWTFLVQITKNV